MSNRLLDTMAVCVAGMLVIGLTMGTVVAQTQEQEPNDDFDTAQQVAEGDIPGEVIDGESDFYQIEANSTDAIDLDLAERDGDIRVRLYGPDRSELADDISGGSRSITQKAPETGTYYVEVFGGDAQTTANYTLNLQKITPAENDAYAPNDDFESAVAVEDGFYEATIWGGESDFYQIEANSTDAIDLALPERNGDIRVRLYGPDRSELADDISGGSRSITQKAPETGTYYVEVFGGDAQTTANYTLNLQKITPAENDAYAPNDDFESAAVLSDEFSDGKLWGGESDFYRVGLNANDGIELALPERNGDIGLRLYGPDRSQLASNRFGGDRSIAYVPTTTGAYFVEVVGGDQGTTGGYTLRSNRTGVPPGTGSLDVSLDPSSIQTNETTTVSVSVTDSGSGNAVTGATISAQDLGVSNVATDETGTAALSLNATAAGEYAVSANAGGYAATTTTLTVTNGSESSPPAAPDDPTQRVLQITEKSNPGELTQNDVTVVITRFNRGQSVNNIDIDQNDVTATITLFERN